jgi:hypothetical protein
MTEKPTGHSVVEVVHLCHILNFCLPPLGQSTPTSVLGSSLWCSGRCCPVEPYCSAWLSPGPTSAWHHTPKSRNPSLSTPSTTFWLIESTAPHCQKQAFSIYRCSLWVELADHHSGTMSRFPEQYPARSCRRSYSPSSHGRSRPWAHHLVCSRRKLRRRL